MGPYGGPFGGGLGSLIGLVAMVALWAAMIWAVMAALRSSRCRGWGGSHHGPGCRGPGGHWHGGSEDPEQILARRYASGEIDEEEFHRRLDHLRSRDPETEKDGTWRP